MTPINPDAASLALGLPIITSKTINPGRVALVNTHLVRPGVVKVTASYFDVELGPEDVEEIE